MGKNFERVHRHSKRRREERILGKLDPEIVLTDKKAYARKREAPKYLKQAVNGNPWEERNIFKM